jgi:small subunit ribosomal protein S25e
MGGGKKKLTLKQMEKTQARGPAKEKKERSGGSRPMIDKKVAEIMLPNVEGPKTLAELKKIRALTPYAVASRFDVRLSVARDFLKELERRGTIEYVCGSKNLKIYKVPD